MYRRVDLERKSGLSSDTASPSNASRREPEKYITTYSPFFKSKVSPLAKQNWEPGNEEFQCGCCNGYKSNSKTKNQNRV